MPVLEIDGLKLTSSYACVYYLVSKFNLKPSDPYQAWICDAVIDNTKDFIDYYTVESLHKHRTQAEHWWEGAKSTKLGYLEGLLANSGGPWLTGDSISIGDIALFEFLWDGFERDNVREKRIGDLEGYPRL